jgi:hypothetical protein
MSIETDLQAPCKLRQERHVYASVEALLPLLSAGLSFRIGRR